MTASIANPWVTSVMVARASSGMRRRMVSKSRTPVPSAVTMKKESSAKRVTVRSDSNPPRSFRIGV